MKLPFFTKRNINKNAKTQPKFIADYSPFSVRLTSIDGTSFACMDRIASEVANLNYGFFNARTKEKMENHHLLKVLRQPNIEDRHYNFFYQSVVDYFNGGCFWFKGILDGKVINLWRINPSEITIQRHPETNRRSFIYKDKVFTDNEITYIPSRFGYSTEYGGTSIFKAVKAVFETNANIETFTQTSFVNGITGKRIVVDIGGAYDKLTDEQLKQLKNSFQKEYTGIENAGRPIFKKRGIEYSELGGISDNKTADLIENRKFQEHEIAKIFGVPEDLLTVASKNGMNIENVFVLFTEFAIRPVATQFQEAINSMIDEDKAYFEFDYNGIMKVSFQQRIDAYIKQVNNGLLSVNEVNAKENRKPVEAGDYRFMPVNLMPLTEETVKAYMAKQKNEMAQGAQKTGEPMDPTDEEAQHFPGGDDKQ